MAKINDVATPVSLRPPSHACCRTRRSSRPQRVAGVEGIVKATVERRAPVVNAIGFVPQLGIPSVQIDNKAAAVEPVEHLYRLGHRHIGLVTGPALSYVSD